MCKKSIHIFPFVELFKICLLTCNNYTVTGEMTKHIFQQVTSVSYCLHMQIKVKVSLDWFPYVITQCR